MNTTLNVLQKLTEQERLDVYSIYYDDGLHIINLGNSFEIDFDDIIEVSKDNASNDIINFIFDDVEGRYPELEFKRFVNYLDSHLYVVKNGEHENVYCIDDIEEFLN